MTDEATDVQRAFETGRRMRDEDRSNGALCRRKERARIYRAKASQRRALMNQTAEGRETLRKETRRALLLHQYGLTLEAFEALWVHQEGACASCGEPMSRDHNRSTSVHVDHCHNTGKVRGLLHHRCNVAIGMLQDDPCLADKAAAYLRKHLH